MKLSVLLSVVALFPALLVCDPALGDEVVMMNGDRLTGEVLEKEGNILKLETGYAGTVHIEWDQVRELRTEEATLIILDDGTELRSLAIALDGEKVVITQSEDEAPVAIARERVAVIRRVTSDPEPGGEFSGRVNLSLKSERGNTKSEDVGADVDLTYRRKVHRLRVLGEAAEDSKGEERTEQNWLLEGTYSYFATKKLYFAGRLQYKHDEFANLDLRSSGGPLIGFQFFESKPLNLLTEAGVIYFREDLSTESGTTDWGLGWHILFDKYVFSDSLQFYHEHSGLLIDGNADDWLWESQTGLRVPLLGGLVGSAEISIDYDSVPAEGTGGTQETYQLLLGYQW